MDEHASLQKSLKWLQDRSKGNIRDKVEPLALKALHVVHAKNGSIRCSFVVPSRASDPDGNWHVGAMATLIDDVAAAVIYSVVDHEEVEIEAKAVAVKGKLSQAVVEIRKKRDGVLIALGKQWMTTHRESVKPSKVSKL